MRPKIKPVREDEGTTWAQFLEAIAPTPHRVCEPQPLVFGAKPEDTARAPPENYMRLDKSTPNPLVETGR